MTKTYKQVITFINEATNYIRSHPEDNKLKYALGRMIKRANGIYENYVEALEDHRVANCAEDPNKVILRDERGGYQFTKEGLQALNKAQRDLANTEVSIEPYIATELPDDLGATDKDSFAGFVIAE